jgi:fibro-slime domain-containing protein
MQSMRHAGITLALFPLTVLTVADPASAQSIAGTLQANYFEVPVSDPDFTGQADFNTITGLVQNTLGPDGLPVVSAIGKTYSGPSGPITDVNSLGELNWWTPGARVDQGVSFTELFDTSAVTTIPLSFTNFFPTALGNDSTYFRTAEWTGDFTLASPATATFFLGSDDDAWLYVDGKLTVDNGGIKPDTVAPTVTSTLPSGTHTFALFYADRRGSNAQIDFSASVALSAIGPSSIAPEPSDLALLAFGLLPLGYAIRRRRRISD